LVIFHAFT